VVGRASLAPCLTPPPPTLGSAQETAGVQYEKRFSEHETGDSGGSGTISFISSGTRAPITAWLRLLFDVRAPRLRAGRRRRLLLDDPAERALRKLTDSSQLIQGPKMATQKNGLDNALWTWARRAQSGVCALPAAPSPSPLRLFVHW